MNKSLIIALMILSIAFCEENSCKRFQMNQPVCQKIKCLYDKATGACVKQKGVAVEITPEINAKYPVNCSEYLFDSDHCVEVGCLFNWNDGQCESKAEHKNIQIEKKQTSTCSDYDYNKEQCSLRDACNFNTKTYLCDTLTKLMTFSEAKSALQEKLIEKDNMQIQKQCSGYKNQTYWCAFFNCVYLQQTGECISREALELHSRIEGEKLEQEELRKEQSQSKLELEAKNLEQKTAQDTQTKESQIPSQRECRSIQNNPLQCMKLGCHSTPKKDPDCDFLDITKFKTL